MKKINLKIKGMHCLSCEILIGDALREAGVKECQINHKTGTAFLEFDEKKVALEKIRKIIEKEGYKVN